MATKAEKIAGLQAYIEEKAQELAYVQENYPQSSRVHELQFILSQARTDLNNYNLCAKTRKARDAYEVYADGPVDDPDTLIWYVIKKYQSPNQEDGNQFARWMCVVRGFNLEIGDVYVRRIVSQAHKLEGEELEAALEYARQNIPY